MSCCHTACYLPAEAYIHTPEPLNPYLSGVEMQSWRNTCRYKQGVFFLVCYGFYVPIPFLFKNQTRPKLPYGCSWRDGMGWLDVLCAANSMLAMLAVNINQKSALLVLPRRTCLVIICNAVVYAVGCLDTYLQIRK